MLLVPLQSGQPVQLQNSLPAFSPRFAIRFRIGLPHFGHFGASPATAWAASRAARFIVLVFLLRFCHNSSRIQRKAEIALRILKKVSALGGMKVMNPVQFITENYNDQN